MSTSNGKPSVLEALAEPRRTDPTHQGTPGSLRGIALKDIQIPAGRARFEQAISDFASYGSPRSLAPDFRSSSDYTQQTKRRNSSPSRFYSPHRPDAIVSSQPIYYPHPHQNHQFDGEGTPIEPFSEFSRRGRDSSAPSPRKPLPRSRSPVYHEPQPVFAHPDDPYPAHALPPAHVPPSEPPYVSGNPFGLNHQRESIHTSQNRPPALPLPVSSPSGRRRLPWYEYLATLAISVSCMPVEFARQLYLLLLLRLPVLYFSRVSRLIEDANLSMVDIRRMATAHADQWNDGTPGSWPTTYLPESALLSPRLHNFKHSWEALIDSLSREWKTQNVVSALMLTAILTVLQIDAAASDPITRTTALLSLIFALMSLIFGSMYLMIFGAMRKMYRAANWAAETLNDHPPTLWNVWILVALPAVWLVWSIVLFVTCIMAFAWRTGASTDHIHAGISHNAAEGLRIGVSAILALALIYFALVVKTLGEFGNKDREWRDQMKQAQGYLDPEAGVHAPLPHHHSHMPPRSFDDTRLHSSRSSTPATDPPRGRRPSRPALQIPSPGPFRSTAATASFNRPADLRADSRKADATFPAAKVIDLQTDKSSSPRTYPLPTLLQTHRDILPPDWGQFTRDLEEVWAGRENDTVGPPPAFEAGAGTREWGLARLMHLWNTHFFRPRFAEAVLRKEEPGFSVYLTPVPPMTEDSSPPQPDHDELKSSRPAVQLQRGSNHLQDVNRDPQGSGMTVLDSSWRTILPASQPPQQIPSAADSSQDLSIPLRASPV